MISENFNPIETPLLNGINLIEASAGTGKTYAIAMLVLRFVVEKNLKIEQLLVVTFTKAATEELKDRVRARLAEAKRALLSTSSPSRTGSHIDANVLTWLEKLRLIPEFNDELIKQRLEAALLNIDQAGIFTIHGFCQRILTEHALESGQLFDVELTGEINAIKQFCADDFWRREVYSRSLAEVSILTAHYKTPDDLLNSVNRVSVFAEIVPPFQALTPLLQQFAELISVAKKQFPELVEALAHSFADGKFKDSFEKEFNEAKEILSNWLGRDAKFCVSTALPDLEILALLGSAGIKDGLNGQKFRAAKGQTGDERKEAYLAELSLENSAFDELAESLMQISLSFRRALVEDLRHSVDLRLQELNLMSFDDLIFRLSQAVENDSQKLLTSALQQRFQVALIDEFQDTDQQQWGIFSALFQSPEQFLYLIGDPKQAIYKFRGADIYSYFSAQEQATHRFTLGKNWRSHPHVVAGVNALFQRQQAFLFDMLEFNPVGAGRKIADGALQYAGDNLPPLMLWQLAESDSGYWTAGKAAIEIKNAVVSEIVSLLNEDFSIAKDLTGFKNLSGLAPHNIAVLVRTNRQAVEYQQALQQAGVPAVLNSIESVYSSTQAKELYTVLQAVANPADGYLLKQALSLDWFNLDLTGFKNLSGLALETESSGQKFYRLINDETALDNWSARFQDYHHDWQSNGLMAMMQKLFANEKVFNTLSASPIAERLLTNLYHLIELLQQEAEQHHLGIHKTLAYLRQAINHPENGGSDEQQLRLESDAQAVKIVTMHRSKGLEYDVVFCPLLWQSNEHLKTEQELIVCHHNGKMLTDLGSSDFEAHREQALAEQLAEDLRVFYVAVTRAKYRLYLAWANVRSQNNPNNSAMAYLFDFAADSFADQQTKLQSFAQQQPDIFAYQLLETPNEITERYQNQQTDVQLSFQQRTRSFYSDWTMSSYTALAALSVESAPEMPMDKAQEAEEIINKEEAILALPKGSHTGNVIHNLLEFNSFQSLANPDYDITAQRDKTCARFGLKLEQPEVINQLLQAVVSTPLSLNDENFCLKNLEAWKCLKEMPFYLSVNGLKVNHINALLQDCPAFAPLNEKQLSGFLTGFIDLICEYQGKFYVMDYKTNWLENYQAQNLTAAMREHNYGLQYWLYSVVLDLYLQNRLPDYTYQQHFGGVRYLFVRGMQPDVPMSGVYADMPDLQRLRALGKVFNPQMR
jgi:exodeoxyribonuclease V beta subunit